MAAGRESHHNDLIRIDPVFILLLFQPAHCLACLQQRFRINGRTDAVPQDRRMVPHCQKLHCHRFRFPVGSHHITASRADQHQRTFSLRAHFRRAVQKVCIKFRLVRITWRLYFYFLMNHLVLFPFLTTYFTTISYN